MWVDWSSQLPSPLKRSLFVGWLLVSLGVVLVLVRLPLEFTLSAVLIGLGSWLSLSPLCGWIPSLITRDGCIRVFLPQWLSDYLLTWLEQRSLLTLFDHLRLAWAANGNAGVNSPVPSPSFDESSKHHGRSLSLSSSSLSTTVVSLTSHHSGKIQRKRTSKKRRSITDTQSNNTISNTYFEFSKQMKRQRKRRLKSDDYGDNEYCEYDSNEEERESLASFGLVDLVLCELLPLHNNERGLILEQMSQKTRYLLFERPLIAWFPRSIQKWMIGTQGMIRVSMYKRMKNNEEESRHLTMGSSEMDPSEEDDSKQHTISDEHLKRDEHADDGNEHIVDITAEMAMSEQYTLSNRHGRRRRREQGSEMGSSLSLNSARYDGDGGVFVVLSDSEDSSTHSSDTSSSNRTVNSEEEGSPSTLLSMAIAPDPSWSFSKRMKHRWRFLRKFLMTHVLRYAPLKRDEVQNRVERPWQRPVFSTVLDSRIGELSVRMVSYLWSKPLSNFNDAQLLSVVCIGMAVFLALFLGSTRYRRSVLSSAVKNSRRLIFVMAGVCFMELCLREYHSQKDTLLRQIMQYLSEKLLSDYYTRLVNEYSHRQQRGRQGNQRSGEEGNEEEEEEEEGSGGGSSPLGPPALETGDSRTLVV